MATIILDTGFYACYIRDKLLENTEKYIASHGLNDQWTISLISDLFGRGETITIQHTSDGILFTTIVLV